MIFKPNDFVFLILSDIKRDARKQVQEQRQQNTCSTGHTTQRQNKEKKLAYEMGEQN